MLPEIGRAYNGSVMRVVRETENTVGIYDKGRMSAGDGDRLARGLRRVAIERTTQNTAAMGLLARFGDTSPNKVRTAFISQASPTGFIASATNMIPVEVVVRGCGIGSWLQRNPGQQPQWFGRRREKIEFFHKQTVVLCTLLAARLLAKGKRSLKALRAVDFSSTRGKPYLADGNYLREELSINLFRVLKEQHLLVPDPLIISMQGQWFLHNPKKPLPTDPAHVMSKALMVVTSQISSQTEREMEKMAQTAFRILSAGFSQIDCTKLGERKLRYLQLADIKFEFGRRSRDGQLVLSDVVNLDSLRLLRNGQFDKKSQVSKQVFRDRRRIATVLAAYRLGTAAMAQFVNVR